MSVGSTCHVSVVMAILQNMSFFKDILQLPTPPTSVLYCIQSIWNASLCNSDLVNALFMFAFWNNFCLDGVAIVCIYGALSSPIDQGIQCSIIWSCSSFIIGLCCSSHIFCSSHANPFNLIKASTTYALPLCSIPIWIILYSL